MRGPCLSTSLVLASICWRGVQAGFTKYLQQSFFFEWDTRPVPVPVVAQCDTLKVTWSRGAATGPNPVSPYFLQVFTSSFPTPFIISAGDSLNIDWPVPFAPNTVFQICMFDKNGNTGGCQRSMTVIPSTILAPSCKNVTFPATPLDVTGMVNTGPFSQYGWIPQCTDLQLKPNNGTPPYTYTFAPQLHPPYNITSNTQDAVNWTIPLSWSSQFFVSIVDSVGNSWSRGPLHSGSSDSDDPPTCLSQVAAVNVPSNGSKKKVSSGAAIGAGVGGALSGLLVGGAIAFFFMRRRVRRAQDEVSLYEKTTPNLGHRDTFASRYHPIPLSSPPPDRSFNNNQQLAGTTLGSRSYNVEPFRLPNEEGTILRSNSHMSPSEDGMAQSTMLFSEGESHATSQPNTASNSDPRSQQQVYVVHHDGGRAPVTVFTPDGTQVVELPPRYIGSDVNGSGADSTAANGRPSVGEGSIARPEASPASGPGSVSLEGSLNQQRRTGPNPRKGRGLPPTPRGGGPGTTS